MKITPTAAIEDARVAAPVVVLVVATFTCVDEIATGAVTDNLYQRVVLLGT